MLDTCNCGFYIIRLVKCMKKCSSVNIPLNMEGLVLNIFFSQFRKRKIFLQNIVVEYHQKHEKINNEEEEELAAHIVYISVDKISRNRDPRKLWWRNAYQN